MINVGTIFGTVFFKDEASSTLNIIERRLGVFEKHTAKIAGGFDRIGKGLLPVSAGIIAAGAGVVKVAVDFENAFSNVVKTVDGLDVDAFGRLNAPAQALRTEIRGLAKEIPILATELAEIAAVGGQFGVSAGGLVNFTEVVAKLGVAVDGISAEDAASKLAQISKIAGVSEDKFVNLASTLVDLGNKGTSTEGVILETTRRFSTAATQAGLAADQMFGMSAAVANLGHQAEVGGTVLQKTFLEITREVGAGGEMLDKFAKASGVSSKQFADHWGRDAAGAFRLLLGGLNEIKTSGGNLAVVMEDLFGKDVAQTAVISGLAMNLKSVDSAMKDANVAFREGTALQEEARKKFSTTENQAKLLRNQLYDVGIVLGGPLLRALRGLMTELEPLITRAADLAEKFADLPQPIQNVTFAVLGLTAAVGPALWLMGQMLNIIGAFSGGGVLGTSVLALGAMAGKIIILTGAIAGLIYGAYKFADASGIIDMYRKAFDALTQAVNNQLQPGGTLDQLWKNISTTGGTLYTNMVSVWEIFTRTLQPVTDLVGQMFGMKESVSALEVVIKAAFFTLNTNLEIINKIAQAWGYVLDKINKVAEAWARFSGKNFVVPDVGAPGAFKGTFSSRTAGANEAAKMPFDQQKDPWTEALVNPLAKGYDAAKKFRDDIAKSGVVPRDWVDDEKERGEKAKRVWEKILEDQKRMREEAAKAQGDALMEFLGADKIADAVRMIYTVNEAIAGGAKLSKAQLDQVFETMTDAMNQIVANGQEVPDIFRTWRDAAKEIIDPIKTIQKILGDQFSTKDFFKESSDHLEGLRQQYNSIILELSQAKWSNLIKRQSGESTAAIYEVGKSYEAAMARFRETPRPLGEAGKAWDRLEKELETGFLIDLEKAIMKSKEFHAIMLTISTIPGFNQFGGLAGIEDVDDAGNKIEKAETKTESWSESVNDLSEAWANFAQISGAATDGLIGKITELMSLMSIGSKIGENFAKSFSTETKDPTTGKINRDYDFSKLIGSEGGVQAVGAWFDMAQFGMESYATMQKATDVKGKGNRIFRGGMTGASIGGSIMPGWGHIIGFVVGAIWGAVRKIGWEEIGNRIGERLGVGISEKLSREIEKTSKSLGGDWHAAEIFHIGDVIKEAGGLNADNFGKFVAEFRDIFVMLETEMFNAAQASQLIDQNFQQFVEAGTDGLGFIDGRLREIVSLAARFGLESKAIREWQMQQGEGLLTAVNGIMGTTAFEEYERVADAIAEAKTEGKDFNDLLKLQQKYAADASAELQDLGTIATSNIFAAVAAGKSLTEAIMEGGEGLDLLISGYENLGLTAEDPLLRMLLIQREVAEGIPNVMTGVGALGDSIVGLTNLNLLNSQSFDAIQRQAGRAYAIIQGEVAKAGGSTKDALLPMQDYLQRAEKAARELGLPLDDNTKMMIEQSKELGIWKELGPSATELMTQSVQDLTAAIDRMTRALLGIPDDLPDPFKTWDPPEDFPKPDPKEPPTTPEDPPPGPDDPRGTPEPGPAPPPAETPERDVTPFTYTDMLSATQNALADTFRSMKTEVTIVDQSTKLLVLPDGRVLAELTADELPGALRRRGITVLGE